VYAATQNWPMTNNPPRREDSLAADSATHLGAEELEALFREHHEGVFRAAYRVTGDSADAQDVLQTVFLRLAKKPPRLDPTRGIAAYLRRAAVNAALDVLRGRRRASAVPLEDMTADPLRDDNPGPDRAPLDRELRRALRKGLSHLSEQAALIFSLRYFEGYDNTDIARQLGMTPTAVGVALHRARGRMQQELRPLAGGSR
jgi:RNA polymerase sigma-70 factor, ECF subfamily